MSGELDHYLANCSKNQLSQSHAMFRIFLSNMNIGQFLPDGGRVFISCRTFTEFKTDTFPATSNIFTDNLMNIDANKAVFHFVKRNKKAGH